MICDDNNDEKKQRVEIEVFMFQMHRQSLDATIKYADDFVNLPQYFL